MNWKNRFSDLRISAKLIVVNILICSVFILISIFIFLAFRHTQGLIKNVFFHDIGEVTTNALTERELHLIESDISFLLNNFFEKEYYLETEGYRLLRLTQDLQNHNKGRELEKLLSKYSQNLDFLLQQCVVVNNVLHLLKISDQEITGLIYQLEEVISEQLINSTLEGEDTGILEQLASLVATYQISILEIAKLRQESWPSHYYLDPSIKGDDILSALDNLILRCRTLTASDPAVAQLGGRLIHTLQEFRKYNLDLHAAMSELSKRIKALEGSKTQIKSSMEALDRDVIQAIRTVGNQMDRSLKTTLVLSLSFLVLLIVALSILTSSFFKNVIKRPIEIIRKGIEGIQGGDLQTRIHLYRNDEWSVIEKALNSMAEKLSESYSTLYFKENIIESASTAIATVDLNKMISYVNPSFIRMWGFENITEVEGRHVTDFWYIEEHSDDIETKLRQEGTWRGEIKARRKDGSLLDVYLAISVVFDAEGKAISILHSSEDITERKRAERKLRESEEKLARSRKMESLGLLAGGVAHDLNNVLSGIVSYPELLLLDLPEDSKLRKPIETIQQSGNQAAAIVQDLLTIARGVASHKEPLNLNDIIRDYLKSPEFIKLEHYHPSVRVETGFDTELFNICGSIVHIRKVIMNLVSNAAEAFEGGGHIIISTRNQYVDSLIRGYEDVTVGEYAVISVSDDGPGISPIYLDRIFEPFFTKKVMGKSGTGLGLAVVWNIVQDHKGYIDVASNNNGTTFELFFPITRDDIIGKDLSIPLEDLKGKKETIIIRKIGISC